MIFYFILGCMNQSSSTKESMNVPKEEIIPNSKSKETADKKNNLQILSDRYNEQATNLIHALEGDIPSLEILTMSEELTQTGVSFIPNIITMYPECKAYLEAVREVAPKLKELPLEEIESGYHADGKLPKTPSPECYHGKDLVVHPATVAALAKIGLTTPDLRQKAKHEIVEVLAHLNAIDTK